MKFTLTIELGNDAMQTPGDVAQTLTCVAENVMFGWDAGTGAIRDAYGNTVGRWEVDGTDT